MKRGTTVTIDKETKYNCAVNAETAAVIDTAPHSKTSHVYLLCTPGHMLSS